MSVRVWIRREGGGWDHYPARHFEWMVAATEWADTVGPRFLDTLRDTCPVNTREHFDHIGTGRLLRSLRMERHTTENGLRLDYTAHTPYAKYVVGGVEPHEMRNRNFPFMHWWDRPLYGHEYFRKFVVHGSNHPQQPNPFHERAMDHDEDMIHQEFFDIIGEHLRRANEEE